MTQVIYLRITTTGSAEVVVTAGSSMDPDIVIADLLGRTVAAALEPILQRGYRLAFVTDHSLTLIRERDVPACESSGADPQSPTPGRRRGHRRPVAKR
ncbi:hypothetical protein [Alicyclobacillus sp.]|uniref:hypothetical protein n=1 Tax=Alicyclobacillus sp. TaxID=61169 RepID=UPI0025BB5D0F|nr:hypothetical protein [Alicyclobacillus sp.]MCL6516758.1 hypothetical protein [Alicyclobacillus sp.]